MSAETQILDLVRTDLKHIDGNGYTVRLSKVFEGYRPLNADNDFDCAYYYIGSRKPVHSMSNNIPAQWEADLWIHIQLKASADESALVRAAEEWIANMRKWLFAGVSPDYASGLTANKWFTADTAASPLIPYGCKSLTEIESYAIWEKYIAELTFKITINY